MWDLGLCQCCLVSTFEHTNLVLELCPRLIFGRYEAGIYVYTWYRNWYKTGTRLVLPQFPTRLVSVQAGTSTRLILHKVIPAW